MPIEVITDVMIAERAVRTGAEDPMELAGHHQSRKEGKIAAGRQMAAEMRSFNGCHFAYGQRICGSPVSKEAGEILGKFGKDHADAHENLEEKAGGLSGEAYCKAEEENGRKKEKSAAKERLGSAKKAFGEASLNAKLNPQVEALDAKSKASWLRQRESAKRPKTPTPPPSRNQPP